MLVPILGRGREDLLAHLFGRDVRDHFKLGAILEHLGQPSIDLRRLAATAK